jgi:endoglycosylceramidase
VYEALDQVRASATIWEVSFSAELWNHEDLTLTDADGSERPIVDEVVRPYPRAIAGELEGFGWDVTARRFVVSASQATREVSEIFVPTRHFGRAPAIEARGARAELVSPGVVAVRSDGREWTLEVRAA